MELLELVSLTRLGLWSLALFVLCLPLASGIVRRHKTAHLLASFYLMGTATARIVGGVDAAHGLVTLLLIPCLGIAYWRVMAHDQERRALVARIHGGDEQLIAELRRVLGA
jgi:hypothetical protein